MTVHVICRDVVELVTEHLEGALPTDERLAVAAHLGRCEGCAAYLQQVRVVALSLGELPAQPADPAVRDALLEAFRKATA